MKVLLLAALLTLVCAAGASANAPDNTTTVAKPYFAPSGIDPRICDSYERDPAAKALKCSTAAASLIAWKTVGVATGSLGPYAPTCVATASLKFRCSIYNSGGAVIAVSWTPVTFVPKVVTGRLAAQWLVAAKARIAAARAAG